MKRIITLLLTVLMLFFLSVPAFARGYSNIGATVTFNVLGFTLSQGDIILIAVIAVIAVLAVVFLIVKNRKNKK